MINISVLRKAACLTATVGFVAFSPLASLASSFSLQDDPDSGWTGLFTTVTNTGVNDNTRLAEGFLAGNFGTETKPLGFVVPFLWSKLPNSDYYANMSWDNDLGGWFTDNFDGTSLLVTLANFPEKVQVGTIANLNGNQPLPLTQPCDPATNPSCISVPDALLPFIPSQTLQPTAKVPFLNLGLFSPNETKSFDIAFQYEFGDHRSGSAQTQFLGYTVAAVPEPATMTGLALAGAGMGLLRQKKKKTEDN